MTLERKGNTQDTTKPFPQAKTVTLQFSLATVNRHRFNRWLARLCPTRHEVHHRFVYLNVGERHRPGSDRQSFQSPQSAQCDIKLTRGKYLPSQVQNASIKKSVPATYE